ncbi:MAG: HAD-IC family P-type ATPase, partial [Acidobacteria bacterium]|nr:HAD-IC family P-type ATPase [Acidobacteriota bacterium]
MGKDLKALHEPSLVPGDRLNMVYAGTMVTYGRGRGVVVATGMRTEFGEIAAMLLGVQHGKSPLQKDLDRLGRALVWAGFGVVLLVTGLAVLRGQPLLEMLLFGIALAVAIVPEALPAVLTISLAIGARRMVKRHVLMRRLSAVEAIGCVSVICADKTGTLTKDEMMIRQIFTAGEMLSVTGTGYEPHGAFLRHGSPVDPSEALRAVLQCAVLSSDALIVRAQDGAGWLVRGDPTEGALVVAAAKAGIHRVDLEERFPRVGEIPFTSESRRMTTLCEGPRGREAFSKGAPEVIVENCTAWVGPRGEAPLDSEARRVILQTAHDLSAQGLRVLVLSRKSNA